MDNDIKKSIELEKEDYILATACGVISGMIDAVFVGNPSNSILLNATDKMADQFVIKAAQFFWKNDKRPRGKQKKMPTELSNAIGYLERAFPVNYDARYAKDLNISGDSLKHMSSSNHHLMSLAHSPDLIGLVFSIIDQFNSEGTASFWDKGKVIHVVPSKTSNNPYPYFYGSDNTAKLYCGFVNWIGHLASDLVGSSSTRQPGKTGRGSGIAMPFYTLVESCDWGSLNGESFAQTMTKVFEEGYDFRFGIATAIPVAISELLTRAVWTIRQKFFKKLDWKESLPSAKNGDFRLFLLMSSTAFEVVDCADATIHAVNIKSGVEMNWVGFFTNVNFIGVTRLSGLVLRECTIRIGSMVASDSGEYAQRVAELIPPDAEKQVMLMSETIRSYFEYLDYKSKLVESLKECKEAKEQRIKIEKEVEESIARIVNCREEMRLQAEAYFEEYLLTVDEAMGLIDEGIITNDSDSFIEGNNLIQSQFGRESQFSSQEEFDDLMNSDDDFRF
jgi:hypothetical protein